MDTIETYAHQLTSRQLRARAEIIRATADQMTRATTRQQLLRIAEEYECLAERLEGVCLAQRAERSL